MVPIQQRLVPILVSNCLAHCAPSYVKELSISVSSGRILKSGVPLVSLCLDMALCNFPITIANGQLLMTPVKTKFLNVHG